MVVSVANLSAMVTGAMDAAKVVATEMLPAAVTKDAVVEATRASAAWLLHHLWAWLAVVRAVAADSLPAAAGSAVEASGPWFQTAGKLLHGMYGWFVTAAVEKLPDVAAEKLLGDAAAWFIRGHGVAVYATLAVVFLAVAFVGGAACAITCRTMKAPGLGGARVPRAVFKANPKLYYATVRSAKRARRGKCVGSRSWRFLVATGFLVAFVAYLVAKVLI